MKRFFVILMCCAIILCISVPCFAEESLRSISDDFSYTFLSFPPGHYTHISDSNYSINSSGYYYRNGSRVNFSSIAFFYSSENPILRDQTNAQSLITASGSLISGWDGVIYFDSPVSLSSRFVTWYNSSSTLDSSVYSGVSSTLTFSGQVLSGLVTLPAIMVFVVLSIGLFWILPIGIGKIKSMIKGY